MDTIDYRIAKLQKELPFQVSEYILTLKKASTKLAYSYEFKRFFTWIIYKKDLNCQINQLTETVYDMDIYIRYLIEIENKGKTERASNHAKVCLSSYCDYCVKLGIIQDNPIKHIKTYGLLPGIKPPEITDKQKEEKINEVYNGAHLSKNKLAYHDKLKNRNAAIVGLYLESGFTIQDIASLKIIDFDKEKYIVKGIYITDNTAHYLIDYLLERQEIFQGISIYEPLFTSLKGNPISIRMLQVLIKEHVKKKIS